MSGLSALRKVAQQAAGSVRRVSSSSAARAGYGNEPVRLPRRTAHAARASSGVQGLRAALALGPYALVRGITLVSPCSLSSPPAAAHALPPTPRSTTCTRLPCTRLTRCVAQRVQHVQPRAPSRAFARADDQPQGQVRQCYRGRGDSGFRYPHLGGELPAEEGQRMKHLIGEARGWLL